jgi:hypothetical protein
MLPRWFRILLATQLAGAVAFVALGLHLFGQGVHSAGAALSWLRPAPPAVHATPLASTTLPSLTGTALPVRSLYGAGAALLSPSLMVRLNRDTGATAVGEYALLLNLEALARDEITRLLGAIAVAPARASLVR